MRAVSGAACTFHLHPHHPISNVQLQAAALRAQLAEQEEELAGLGEGLGGLERENSNLEAQVGAVCGFVFVTGATHGSCLQTGTGPGGLRVSNLEAKAPPCARVALVDGGVCPRRNRHLQVDQVTQALIETQAAKAQLERRVAELEQVIQIICVFSELLILLVYGVGAFALLQPFLLYCAPALSLMYAAAPAGRGQPGPQWKREVAFCPPSLLRPHPLPMCCRTWPAWAYWRRSWRRTRRCWSASWPRRARRR